MRIGELSQVTGVEIETIRYYEREGLLPAAPRSQGNYRIYEPAHSERLSFIRHCRGLGMALDEVRVLLRAKDSPAESCEEVNALLDDHIEHVAKRVRELNALARQLKALRVLCQDTKETGACGILHGLAKSARSGSGSVTGTEVHAGGIHGRPQRGKPAR